MRTIGFPYIRSIGTRVASSCISICMYGEIRSGNAALTRLQRARFSRSRSTIKRKPYCLFGGTSDPSQLPTPMIAFRAPEYFPRIGYFALMRNVGQFIIVDTRQYSRQSFHNRTRLRTPDGWQWITVPLKGGQHGRSISDVEIDRSVMWQTKHMRSLAYNYRSSPFFEYYEDKVTEHLKHDWECLGELTSASVLLLRELLSISTPTRIASLAFGDNDSTADMLRITDERTVAVLDEPGRSSAVGDQLSHIVCEPEAYRQVFDGFEHGMSVLDLLFNYGPEAGPLIDKWTSIGGYEEGA